VSPSDVEDLSGLPPAILCSHCYVVFPQFEVAEDDEDEGVLRYVARLSSGRDLVEEFIGIWLGTRRSMPPADADLGRLVGAKSCPHCGFTWSEPSHICARGGGRGREDCGEICAEDGDSEELGYPRFECSVEPHF
jgi:hypothetical protein